MPRERRRRTNEADPPASGGGGVSPYALPGPAPLRACRAGPGYLESVGNALELSRALSDNVEAHVPPGELRMGGQPALRGAAQAPLLLGVHHLQRVAVAVLGLALDLAEHEPGA